MRIIAGELKGRNVELPAGSRARPTTGFVRELLMNLLVEHNTGGTGLLQQGGFADLFAASGVTGFEALSRGAPEAVFVEADARHAGQIRRNAFAFGVAGRVKVLHCDVRRCLRPLQRHLGERKLAVVFADPPYIQGFATGLAATLAGLSALCLPAGRFIIRSVEQLPAELPGLGLLESRNAGKGRLFVYQPLPQALGDSCDEPQLSGTDAA